MTMSATHPRRASASLDIYFLEVRAKLLEIAATLDRVDRSSNPAEVTDDPRMAFIRKSLAILQSAGPQRTQKIQELYSLS